MWLKKEKSKSIHAGVIYAPARLAHVEGIVQTAHSYHNCWTQSAHPHTQAQEGNAVALVPVHHHLFSICHLVESSAGFTKQWQPLAPFLVGPAGWALLPLSLCIISLHTVPPASGQTRGLKRFIRILFLFTLWSAAYYGAFAAGMTLRFKHSNSP